MRVRRATNNNFIIPAEQNDEEGAERLWVAETVCQSVCRVQLRRELQSGAFERATLEQGADERAFGETAKIQKKYCGRPGASSGPAIKRISVRVTAVEDRAGQPTAKRIDGYVTLRQTCAGGGVRLKGRSALVFRGTLAG